MKVSEAIQGSNRPTFIITCSLGHPLKENDNSEGPDLVHLFAQDIGAHYDSD